MKTCKKCGCSYEDGGRCKECQKRYRASYYDENKQKENDAARQWRKANPGYFIQYSKVNAESLRARFAKYRQENKAASLVHGQNRRARERSAGGRISIGIADRLMVLQKGRCACCKVDLKVSGRHLDHIQPLARGGSNDDRNIQLLCPSCNLRKSAKHPVEFMRESGFLL